MDGLTGMGFYMAPKDTHRKLTAILCADVAGYSRLMGADEESTIETLTTYREVFLSRIESNRGRVVDAKGDAILAEFASVVDAVSSAVEIQQQLAEENTKLSAERRMDFRIGINMGDVVVKEDAIYGDGVNVAARLESLAEPGCICLSRSAYDQVKNKLKLEYEYLGEQKVKNIEEPVRAYKITGKPRADGNKMEAAVQTPSEETPALELPEEPSIAVLAFDNMSGDPEQEYFSDGLTEDIITDLSMIPRLFVIARNSSFSFKGKSFTLQQVGRELGVRFALEGSVRKSGNRVRVTAQLIECATGHHLWAKRYDRGLEDIFTVQDELTKEIVTALDVKLVSGEAGRHNRNRYRNPEAGEALYRAMAYYHQFEKASHFQAKELFEQFTQLEPDSTVGYVWLAQTCLREVFLHWTEDRDNSIEKMGEYSQKALALDDQDPLALGAASSHQLFLGNHDQCIAYAKQGVANGPGLASPFITLGWFQLFAETPLEAVENLKRGMRLSPIVSAPQSAQLGSAYRNSGQMELAVATLKNTVKRFPKFVTGHVGLATCYGLMGMEEEAKSTVKEILRLDPSYSISRFSTPNFFRNKETMEKWAQPLREAGLPE